MKSSLFGAIAGGGSVSPITLVAHVATGANGVPSAAIDTTGANLIVISQSGVSSGTSAPTDSKGNTWTALTEYSGGSTSVQLFYCSNPTVGAGHTFTPHGVSVSIAVSAFSETLNAIPDGSSGAGSASATTQQPGSLTPSVDNCLVVTGLMYISGVMPGPATISAGFDITDNAGNASTFVPVALAYQVQTTATAVNPTWSTNAAAEKTAAAMAVFKHK
jgi:hypothetical protein